MSVGDVVRGVHEVCVSPAPGCGGGSSWVERREGGAVGAKGRRQGGGRKRARWVVRRWLAARRRRSISEQQYGRNAVSACLTMSLSLRAGRQLGGVCARLERESSVRRLDARLSPVLQIARECVWTAGRVSALLHVQFRFSQHVQGFANLVAGSLPPHSHGCHPPCHVALREHALASMAAFTIAAIAHDLRAAVNVPPGESAQSSR